jgi:hypothetical protein
MMRSAHSTRPTKIAGLPNFAPCTLSFLSVSFLYCVFSATAQAVFVFAIVCLCHSPPEEANQQHARSSRIGGGGENHA